MVKKLSNTYILLSRPHFRLTSVAQKTLSLKLPISKIVASTMTIDFVDQKYS